MSCIRPFPEQQPAKADWADDVCTWERFERAVGRSGADVGVGSDGYCGYLMRKVPTVIFPCLPSHGATGKNSMPWLGIAPGREEMLAKHGVFSGTKQQ